MNEIFTVTGLVLRAVDYGEYDKIITVYTPTAGKLSANAKGVKKAGAKLKHAAQPLCFAEFDFIAGKAGYKLVSARVFDTFFEIYKKTDCYFAAAAVLELTDAFCTEEADAGQFLLAVKTIKELCYGTVTAVETLAAYLPEFLAQSGYFREDLAAANPKKTVIKCNNLLSNINGRQFKSLKEFLAFI